ncbi:MAG: hypothetical protein ABI868_11505 [Acidobacteriota bacterium]
MVNVEDRERLRQRMDDLLRDARALRELIEDANHTAALRSDRQTGSSLPASSPPRRARRTRRG